MTHITQMGVTVAVPAKYVDGLSPADLQVEVQALGEQAQPALRHYVGGTIPQGPVAVDWAGPVDDPIQGGIYALSLAAPFDADQLPVDCQAYLDYNGGQGGTTEADHDVTVNP